MLAHPWASTCSENSLVFPPKQSKLLRALPWAASCLACLAGSRERSRQAGCEEPPGELAVAGHWLATGEGGGAQVSSSCSPSPPAASGVCKIPPVGGGNSKRVVAPSSFPGRSSPTRLSRVPAAAASWALGSAPDWDPADWPSVGFGVPSSACLRSKAACTWACCSWRAESLACIAAAETGDFAERGDFSASGKTWHEKLPRGSSGFPS